jgi:hypothetical protein
VLGTNCAVHFFSFFCHSTTVTKKKKKRKETMPSSPSSPPQAERPHIIEASLFDREMQPRILYSTSSCALSRALTHLIGIEFYPSALTRCTTTQGRGAQKQKYGRCFAHGVGIRHWTREQYSTDVAAKRLHRHFAQKVESVRERRDRLSERQRTDAQFFEPTPRTATATAAAAAAAAVTV